MTITEAVEEYGPVIVVGAGATPPPTPPPPNASTRRFLCVILAESPRQEEVSQVQSRDWSLVLVVGITQSVWSHVCRTTETVSLSVSPGDVSVNNVWKILLVFSANSLSWRLFTHLHSEL